MPAFGIDVRANRTTCARVGQRAQSTLHAHVQSLRFQRARPACMQVSAERSPLRTRRRAASRVSTGPPLVGPGTSGMLPRTRTRRLKTPCEAAACRLHDFAPRVAAAQAKPIDARVLVISKMHATTNGKIWLRCRPASCAP
eukprot:5933962-Pleurochrysis_carterae.AAC.2